MLYVSTVYEKGELWTCLMRDQLRNEA